MKNLFILGSRDIEMDLIEKVLTENGELFCHAVSPSGERVSARDAAGGNWSFNDAEFDLEMIDQIILVELTPPENWPWKEKTLVFDHHGQGHMQHPAIYQVAAYLVGGMDALVGGCADHDLRSAYRHFPVDIVLDFRRRALNLTPDDLDRAKTAVETSPTVGGVRVIEQSPSPLVADILMSRSEMGLVCVPSDKEGVRKWVFSGDIARELAEAIIDRAKAQNLEYYWFPARSLGGVYCDDPQSLIPQS
jgi:hypothetical protein